MLVALTVTPALCLILLSRGKLDKRESPLPVLKRAYGAVLALLVRCAARRSGSSPRWDSSVR